MFLETIPDLLISWQGKTLHATVTFMKSEINNGRESALKVPRYLFVIKDAGIPAQTGSPFLIIVPELDTDGSRWIPHESSGIKDRLLTKAAGAALELFLAAR